MVMTQPRPSRVGCDRRAGVPRCGRGPHSSALAALFVLLGVASAHAQFSQARLTGIVRDESGAPIQGASVLILDQETGLARSLTTSSTGFYTAPDLRPSRYRLQVELAGFTPVIRKGIRLNAGTTLSLDVALEVSPVAENLAHPAETITVLGETPLVNTAQSQVSQVVQQEAIQNLPLNGRNFLELAFLVPGNSPTANYDPTKARVVEVSSAGQLGRGGNVTVDGVDNNDDVVGGLLQNFSVDAVQEFQVVTNRYSAEIGRSASSAVNIVTRSGVNDMHGSGSFFFRNDALQSRNPLVAETGGFERKQLSFTLGGPIRKDRAHWFASYERTREDGAEIAGRRNLSTRTVETFFTPVPYHDNLLLGRLDCQATRNDKLFLRYARQTNDQTNQGTLRAPVGAESNLQVAHNRIDSIVVGWTRIVRSSLVNSFRAHYNDFKNAIDPIAGAPVPELQFPSILEGRTFRAPQATVQKRLQLKDDLNWSRGNHAFKLGFDFHPKIEWSALFDLFGSGTVILTQDFATEDRDGDGRIDDNDIPISAAIKSLAPRPPFVKPPDNRHIAVYAQDDWRVRRNLTLNYGLRWELDTDVNGVHAANQFRPGERHLDKNNLGPRVGFSWDPLGTGAQTIRGGYGLYYDRIVLEVSLLERLLDGRTLPIALFRPESLREPFSGPRANVPIGINVLDNDLTTPYAHQATLGFQRQFARDYAVSVDAVYDRGEDFILGVEVNHPRADVTVNPLVGDSVVELANRARTSYKGILVTLQKRMGHGFSFLASYTLSKAKNYSNDDQIPFAAVPLDDPLDVDREFSTAATDERHRFVLSGTLELPWGIKVSPLVTLSSGLPFDIRQSTDFDGDGVADRFPLLPRNAGARDVVTGAELNALIDQFNTDPRHSRLRDRRGRGYEHVDPSLDFTHPFKSVDFRVSKTFKLGLKQARLELLAEVFNAFNSLNIRGFFLASYSGVGTDMESATFGRPLSTAGGVFGSGGPRAAQLGVKLTF